MVLENLKGNRLSAFDHSLCFLLPQGEYDSPGDDMNDRKVSRPDAAPRALGSGLHVWVGLRRHILGVLLTAYPYQPFFRSPRLWKFEGHFWSLTCLCIGVWLAFLAWWTSDANHPEMSPAVAHRGSMPTPGDKRASAEKH